ncbi:MAG: glycosyltransferase, partial [Agathobacter sp.]
PLSKKASRGDQILNAASFEKQGFSAVLDEDTLTSDQLLTTIEKVYNNRKEYIEKMEAAQGVQSIDIILSLIEEGTVISRIR